MHDIKVIRADPAAFDAALARRGIPPTAGRIVELDKTIRALIRESEQGRAELKLKSREVGQLKAAKKFDEAEALIRQIAEWDVRQSQWLGRQTKEPSDELEALLCRLPNLLDTDVPDGTDAEDNVVKKIVGSQANFSFIPRQHFELGEALGMDFATASKLAGSRFTILRGPLARMERALGQWMLNLHTEQHGYTECAVPLLVNEATMYGTGQLPKFKEDLFETLDGRYLIPTAEVPLTNFVREEILPESALPMRLTALSQCFRSEAGSAGRDTRGMLRQHQFQKVELVSITAPTESAAEHERMTACAERVLTELGLTWRRLLLCAGDTGFGAAKTYDLEVWLPGQQAWREISSCSNCRDFQARRMDARFRPAGAKGTEFLHTLNGSGVAVGRALIAVMETHQNEDGSITIPEVLRPWMGGLEVLRA